MKFKWSYWKIKSSKFQIKVFRKSKVWSFKWSFQTIKSSKFQMKLSDNQKLKMWNQCFGNQKLEGSNEVFELSFRIIKSSKFRKKIWKNQLLEISKQIFQKIQGMKLQMQISENQKFKISNKVCGESKARSFNRILRLKFQM